ncbi:HYD1 signature containing ADP-ribosyltransferase family protein [Nocardia sp. alder85J]|uniref:HYD1 signature containing ADP-ribosyltransferase family protein n=1 Tax=Nocardia sp. alder85J TaxID=2862949 RepID=UPI001CD4F774|nr:HYD1 signature containing ADP-ribosyltransferase family protein [Nocardia sp. alder85J]MCX4095890.1 hypothetical protein [Nocardia sp. alder85J]
MTAPIELMKAVADGLGNTAGRVGRAFAEWLGGIAHAATDSAAALEAGERAAAPVIRTAEDVERRSVADEYAAAKAATGSERPARILYHYTSGEGLEGILGSGRLRPAWGPGDRRGQFLTTIRPGTHTDVELENYLGLSVSLSHYIALDVSELPARKIVPMMEGNFMIRNRRSLRIGRLLVDSGENPVRYR